MNTKGIKFLAVLAVLAMAFAAVAVIAPVQGNDADATQAINVYTECIAAGTENVSEITADTGSKYYFSEDASVKVTGLAAGGITVYVNNSVSVELKFKITGNDNTEPVTIFTVSGDRAGKTAYVTAEDEGQTQIKFTPENKSTFVYTAAEIKEFGYDLAGIEHSPFLSENATFYYSGILVLDEATGDDLDVAAGEEIKIKEGNINSEKDKFGYGIAYTAVESEVTYIYFTAPGASKTGYNLEDAGAQMWVLNGSGSASYLSTNVGGDPDATGTVTVTFSGAKASEAIVAKAGQALNVTNATAGTITVAGKGNFELAGTLAAKATIDIGKDIYLLGGITENNGKIILNNSGMKDDFNIVNKGTVVAKNSALWKTGGIKGIDADSTGFVDTSAISAILPTTQGEVVDLKVGLGQVVTLNGNLTVSGQLVINGGILNIGSGVTVTIKEGGIFTVGGNYSTYTQVINQGTISIKAGDVADGSDITSVLTIEEKATFDNQGTIKAESKAPATNMNKNIAISNASEKFVNNGKITISRNDTFDLGKVTLTNNGQLDISGTITADATAGGTIQNEGSISFINGSVIGVGMTIKMKSTAASVDVKGVTIESEKKLTIMSEVSKKKGSIDIAPTGTTTGTKANIKNFSVANSAGLDVSGTASIDVAVKATMGGLVNVSGSLTIPKDMTLYMADDAKVKVSGTLTLALGSTVGVQSLSKYEVAVTGKIIDYTNNLVPTTGVVYYGTNAKVVTTFADALTEAVAADLKSVEVFGVNDVEGIVVIPEGMNVYGSGSLNLKSGTITVSVGETESASLGVKVTVESGVLYSDDKETITVAADADVAMEEESEDITSITYMDLATALSIVEGTITLNKDVVMKTDVVIPEDVILNAMEKKFQVYGATLTVEGELIVDSATSTADAPLIKDSHVALASMVVDGYYSMKATEIGKGTFWYPAGVLYNMVDEEGTEFYVITSINNLSTAIAEDEDGTIDITSNTKVGDLSIVGTEEKPVVVNLNGDINAGTILLSDATINTNNNKIIAAQFESLTGAIIIKNASTTKLVITEDDGLTATGTVDDIIIADTTKAETPYTLAFEGIVGVGGFTADNTATEYADKSDAPAIDVDGILTASGKTVTFETGIIVTGKLIADNSTKIVVNGGNVQLLGDLIAVEKTESAAAGSIAVNTEGAGAAAKGGNIYAGALYDDMFVTSAGATMSGNITFDGTAFVLATATIDPEIVEDLNYLDIAIDSVDYITLYTSGTTVSFEKLLIPLTSAEISGIVDENGKSVVKEGELTYNALENTITAVDFSITTIDWIDVTINEEVYTVVIKTDDGVKSVALNGILMIYGEDGTNVFHLDGLEAGSYTVSYTLKSGYEGTPVLTTEMGTILQGYNIVLSGDFDKEIVYQLTGTHKEVAPEPVEPEKESEWNITTILLCILVVLIAIMAVIVALRLNRS